MKFPGNEQFLALFFSHPLPLFIKCNDVRFRDRSTSLHENLSQTLSRRCFGDFIGIMNFIECS